MKIGCLPAGSLSSPTFDLLAAADGFDRRADGVPNLYVVAIADIVDFSKIETLPHLKTQFDQFSIVHRFAAARFVIDAATEGWSFQEEYFHALHTALAKRSIAPAAVSIVTTNHDLPGDYSSWAKAAGLAEIGFTVYDYWCYKMATVLKAEVEAVHDGFQRKALARGKVVCRAISLNRIFKAHRAAVVASLSRDEHFSSSLVSLMPDRHALDRGEKAELMTYLRQLNWPSLDRLHDRIGLVLDKVPVVLDSDSATPYLHYVYGAAIDELYDQVAIAIVSESDFGVPGVDRVTEKPFKAIANCCPILLVGQPNQLKRLRRLGFEMKTFVPTDYDAIDPPDARLEKIIHHIEYICDTDIGRLEDLRASCYDSNRRDVDLLLDFATPHQLNLLAQSLIRSLS